MGQIGWRDAGLKKPILDPLTCIQTKSLDEKSSLLVDANHLRLFAERCTKTQLS